MVIVLEICETPKWGKRLLTKKLWCSKCHDVNFAFTAEETRSNKCKIGVTFMVWSREENCATRVH